MVIDGVDDVDHDGGEHGLASLDKRPVGRGIPAEEGLNVLHPGREVEVDELCVDVLHGQMKTRGFFRGLYLDSLVIHRRTDVNELVDAVIRSARNVRPFLY